MIKFHSLTLENFGPYFGTQVLTFQEQPGVLIVFGNNGRGKTSLLNALRYALYGRVRPRATQEITIFDLLNIEAREQGTYQAKVILTFSAGSDEYQLVRAIRPAAHVTEAKSSADLTPSTWLTKNGNSVPALGVEPELARLMPIQVSRFFLFDGELLEEYEVLLRNDLAMADEIKAAIERILGLPVLSNAKNDMSDIAKKAARQEASANTQDSHLRKLQAGLRSHLSMEEIQERDIEDSEQSKRDLEERRAIVMVELQKHDALRDLIEERSRLAVEIKQDDARVDELLGRLRLAMTDSWKSVLREHLLAKRQSLSDEHDALLRAELEVSSARVMIELLERSLKDGKCGLCEHGVDATSSSLIGNQIGPFKKVLDRGVDLDKLQAVRQSLAVLDGALAEDKRGAIAQILDNIEDQKIRLIQKKQRAEELKDLTKEADEDALYKLTQEDRKLTEQLTLLNLTLKNQKDELVRIRATIQDVNNRIDKLGAADLAKERRLRELSTSLRIFFTRGVEIYRDRLREKVEKSASDVFVRLTNEPEYKSLRINANYGLKIMHESGKTVTVRSAGNEHIVALSLMAALQQNAPVKGPIIMDSPFGRLDPVHTKNVICALPTLSDQTMLLVYESEVNAEEVRQLLQGSLRAEYKIARVSAFHSKLEPVISA